jgi:molybdate-binding protein
MNKEIIEEYQRMKKERDKLYVLMLNTQKGSGARMMRDDIYVKDANIKNICGYTT